MARNLIIDRSVFGKIKIRSLSSSPRPSSSIVVCGEFKSNFMLSVNHSPMESSWSPLLLSCCYSGPERTIAIEKTRCRNRCSPHLVHCCFDCLWRVRGGPTEFRIHFSSSFRHVFIFLCASPSWVVCRRAVAIYNLDPLIRLIGGKVFYKAVIPF